jgi:uncharacterized protein YbaR (Trm112 family)
MIRFKIVGRSGGKEMMRLKACPRCRGDLMIEQEHHNWSEYCLQCGYQRELPTEVEMAKRRAKILPGGKNMSLIS